MSRITAALLRRQDDVCSQAVLHFLRHKDTFRRLAMSEGSLIVRRDKEDEKKLSDGIRIARARGLLPEAPAVPPPTRIPVAGRTAQEVTNAIVQHLPAGGGGNVIVLQGLSGTGKGTTVGGLRQHLPRCVAWSNGNVFRSYAYLLRKRLQGEEPLRAELLTPELIRSVEKQVTFEWVGEDQYDIVLEGKIRVADIQNTLLKTPEINAAVPTVAQQTQGEVIRFAVEAISKLSKAGYNVVVEGRAQTLDYIPTSFRFELVIDDVVLLGERRAAQRVMAKAFSKIRHQLDDAPDTFVEETLLQALNEL